MFTVRKLLPAGIIAISIALTGCKTDPKDAYKGLSAAQLYEKAQTSVLKENYHQAAKDFEALEARFPYGEYSEKAQLGLMKAYYKQNEPELARGTANRFIRLNPRHPNADYAYYLKGLVSFDQNYSFSFRYLPLDKSARDPSVAAESFEAFKEFIDKFPSSPFVPDAKKRMIFLREQLAQHEMQVIDYYLKRGAYVSATNRANYVLKHFPKSPVIPKALFALVFSYQKLGMKSLFESTLNVLQYSYPHSEELKKANALNSPHRS